MPFPGLSVRWSQTFNMSFYSIPPGSNILEHFYNGFLSKMDSRFWEIDVLCVAFISGFDIQVLTIAVTSGLIKISMQNLWKRFLFFSSRNIFNITSNASFLILLSSPLRGSTSKLSVLNRHFTKLPLVFDCYTDHIWPKHSTGFGTWICDLFIKYTKFYIDWLDTWSSASRDLTF